MTYQEQLSATKEHLTPLVKETQQFIGETATKGYDALQKVRPLKDYHPLDTPNTPFLHPHKGMFKPRIIIQAPQILKDDAELNLGKSGMKVAEVSTETYERRCYSRDGYVSMRFPANDKLVVADIKAPGLDFEQKVAISRRGYALFNGRSDFTYPALDTHAELEKEEIERRYTQAYVNSLGVLGLVGLSLQTAHGIDLESEMEAAQLMDAWQQISPGVEPRFMAVGEIEA